MWFSVLLRASAPPPLLEASKCRECDPSEFSSIAECSLSGWISPVLNATFAACSPSPLPPAWSEDNMVLLIVLFVLATGFTLISYLRRSHLLARLYF
jgi:hypothetical protein